MEEKAKFEILVDENDEVTLNIKGDPKELIDSLITMMDMNNTAAGIIVASADYWVRERKGKELGERDE